MEKFALNYSFSRNLPVPLDADFVKETYAEALNFIQTKSKYYEGEIFSIIGDTEDKNGLYQALGLGENARLVPCSGGGSKGSLSASTFEDAMELATASNEGTMVMVKTETYSYQDENGDTVYSTTVPEGVDDYKTYEVGPYLIAGEGVITKLATSSADGTDVSSSLEALKAQVATLEGYLYWETDGSENNDVKN